jgi:hypothetical protein
LLIWGVTAASIRRPAAEYSAFGSFEHDAPNRLW